MKTLMAMMLLSCAGFVSAQESSYEVHRVTEPIVVDGVVTEEEWGNASQAVEFVFPWDDQAGAKQITRARLLWDNTNLYVAYQCEDTDVGALVTDRDGNVYRDDTVEIFVNVVPSQTVAYFGLEMNVECVYMDYLWTDREYYHKNVQFEGLQIATTVDGTLNNHDDIDTGWSLEVAIPWRNFTAMGRRGPRVGTVYEANMSRWDGIEPNRRLSMWLDSGLDWAHPHEPASFGELHFVE